MGQDSIGQTAVEGIDGGLHPAVGGTCIVEVK